MQLPMTYQFYFFDKLLCDGGHGLCQVVQFRGTTEMPIILANQHQCKYLLKTVINQNQPPIADTQRYLPPRTPRSQRVPRIEKIKAAYSL